ncbi:MAG: hypothetical protein IPL43_02290 [Micropruina sp.]|nr:hypothetical protein [Micropruina sp.]
MTATKAADTNYNVATTSGTIRIGKESQAALLVESTSGTFGEPLTLQTSGGSGSGEVTFVAADGTASGCVVSASPPFTLSVGSAGTCLVTATKAGDDAYDEASSAPTEVTFAKAIQQPLLLTSTEGTVGQDLALTTSGGSGTGEVSFVVDSGPCSVLGATLSITASGACFVTATKAEDGNYQAQSSASTSIDLAGPVSTGARQAGFWQNGAGQKMIKSGTATAGVCDVGTWLRGWAPFQGLTSTASCANVAAYVTTVGGAVKKGGPAAQLKAEMLVTALNVYFSDAALGGNRIGAPAPVGGIAVDLTRVCTDVSCTTFVDSSSVFGPADALLVSQMLDYAASQSNSGGSTWYGNVATDLGLARQAFLSINRGMVIGG